MTKKEIVSVVPFCSVHQSPCLDIFVLHLLTFLFPSCIFICNGNECKHILLYKIRFASNTNVAISRICLLFEKLFSSAFFYSVSLFSRDIVFDFDLIIGSNQLAYSLLCYNCVGCEDRFNSHGVGVKTVNVSDTDGYSCAVSESLFSIVYR